MLKKKPEQPEKDNAREPIREQVHDMWEEINEEIEKHELDIYINDDNTPNIKKINESDDVGVEEVLMIGSMLTLNKLHQLTHKADVSDMLDGKLDFEVIAPKNMPPELKKLVKEITDVVKKHRGKDNK